ncbi:MAG: hypothetical protein ACKOUK_04380 [Verrucomicrobiota bacterium]
MNPASPAPAPAPAVEEILAQARRLREGIPGDIHEHLVESLYADAGRIAERSVSRPDRPASA